MPIVSSIKPSYEGMYGREHCPRCRAILQHTYDCDSSWQCRCGLWVWVIAKGTYEIRKI